MSAEAVPIIRTTKLSVLTSDQALANWEVVGGMLAGALRYALGRISLEDAQTALANDLGLIVIAWNPNKGAVHAAFFCEIDRYPTGRQCFNVALAGGSEMKEWAHLWPSMKEIARQHGCDHIELTGRPGWGRALGLKEVARLYIEDV
jgi:hypothetical protein